GPPGQLPVTGHVPGLDQAQHGLQIVAGHRHRLLDRTDGVVEADGGVPDGVPDAVGDPADVGPAGVEQDEIEVAARGELAPPQAADGDQGDVLSVAGRAEEVPQPAVDVRGPLLAGRRVRARLVPHRSPDPPLQSLRPALPRPHPDHGVDRDGPDLAVADLAGLRRLDDDVDDVLGVVLLGQDLHADLGHQVHLVLGAAVDLGVTALPAVAARLADGHALDAELLQGGLHVIELERLDDGCDEPHASTFLGAGVTGPLGELIPEAWTVPRS